MPNRLGNQLQAAGYCTAKRVVKRKQQLHVFKYKQSQKFQKSG